MRVSKTKTGSQLTKVIMIRDNRKCKKSATGHVVEFFFEVIWGLGSWRLNGNNELEHSLTQSTDQTSFRSG